MEKFLSQYINFLDENKKHLSHETISTYINLYNNLSLKERQFIEKVIVSDEVSKSRFEEVFDDELDMDDAKVEMKVIKQMPVDSNNISFVSSEKNIKLNIINDAGKQTLEIISFPAKYKNVRIRLNSINDEFILRITSCKMNYVYSIDSNIDIEKIETITIESVDNKIISVPSKKNKWWYAAAAVIVISFSAVYLLMLYPQKDELISKQITPEDSLIYKKQMTEDSLKVDNKLLAENNDEDFKTNTILDNFINRNIRSEENGIKLLSPELNDSLKLPIAFKWESKRENALFRIQIVNNKNEVVFDKTTKENKLICNANLIGGLYYWKIYSDNKLTKVSRFYLKN